MNYYEDSKENPNEVVAACKICYISHKYRINNSLFDFDKLTRVYSYIPVEATNFERFFDADLKHGVK
jgi:hypothetical protein